MTEGHCSLNYKATECFSKKLQKKKFFHFSGQFFQLKYEKSSLNEARILNGVQFLSGKPPLRKSTYLDFSFDYIKVYRPTWYKWTSHKNFPRFSCKWNYKFHQNLLSCFVDETWRYGHTYSVFGLAATYYS